MVETPEETVNDNKVTEARLVLLDRREQKVHRDLQARRVKRAIRFQLRKCTSL